MTGQPFNHPAVQIRCGLDSLDGRLRGQSFQVRLRKFDLPDVGEVFATFAGGCNFCFALGTQILGFQPVLPDLL
ncbi:hypothetical protein [Mycolicibacterium fortuitum]|uniref:hypothetical protein n=1 Tax=Mycolicibacterium fortuitum TaxID=1766 RepID=UPI002631FFB8|nr:hypothetical protein [Mycolicibacterium fortuitum]